jgi:hypothetical protein
MDYAGYLKSLSQVDGPDGLFYKAVIHIRKDKTTLESRAYLDAMAGQCVSVSLAESDDEDYETPTQRKNREEREKYDGVMSERKRHEAAAAELPLETKAEEEPVAITPVEILAIGDFRDPEGNVFTVVPLDGKFVHDARGDDEKLAQLAMDSTEYETAEAAREALKVWAADKHGYEMVAPVGYRAVYSKETDDEKQFSTEETDGFIFAGYTTDLQGEEVPVTEEVSEAPAAPAMIYKDGDASYYVAENPASGEWHILKTENNEESLISGPYADQVGAQDELINRAQQNGWVSANVIELLEGGDAEPETEQTLGGLAEQEATNVAQANPEPEEEAVAEPALYSEEALPEPPTEPETEPIAEEMPQEPTQEAADDVPAPEAAPEAENAPQDVAEPIPAEVDEDAEPQAEAGLFGAIIEVWDTPDAITFVTKNGQPDVNIRVEGFDGAERSVKLFGYGTVFADELNEKYAAVMPPYAEEPVAEPAAEPTTDPFDDGSSIENLFDWLLAKKTDGKLRDNGGVKIKVKEEFLKEGDRRGPINVLDVIAEPPGVKLLGKGILMASTINEQYEVCK